MATTYPASCPTQPLSWAVIDKYKIMLLQDGAGAEALLRSEGAPVGVIITGFETAGNLIRQNSAIREDIRFSNKANLLIESFGVSYAYDGVTVLRDPFNRRFTCAGGVYTEVPAFILTAATKGQKAIVRPAYRTAPYEETFWFDPNVFTQLMVAPPTAPHPDFTFNPVDYSGRLKLYNIQTGYVTRMGTSCFIGRTWRQPVIRWNRNAAWHSFTSVASRWAARTLARAKRLK